MVLVLHALKLIDNTIRYIPKPLYYLTYRDSYRSYIQIILFAHTRLVTKNVGSTNKSHLSFYEDRSSSEPKIDVFVNCWIDAYNQVHYSESWTRWHIWKLVTSVSLWMRVLYICISFTVSMYILGKHSWKFFCSLF